MKTTCAVIALLAAWSARGDEKAARLHFTDFTKESGIEFKMTSGATPSQHIIEVDGGGVALFDYDNDGDLDVFFANGATIEKPEEGPGSRLYANNGDGTFKNVTEKVGIKLTRWAMGVAVGDYDADGCDDLYVTCYGPNVLLRNECQGRDTPRFVDVTEKAGVGDARWSTSAAFGDLDNDHDLDLYVVNYLEFDTENPPSREGKSFLGVPVMAGPQGLAPQHDVVYENQGDGTFKNVTKESGCVPDEAGFGLVTAILDFDADGKQDIFVGNDSTENFLWQNKGGFKFENIGLISGIACNADGGNQATMGIGVGDVDGTGTPDVFTTNFSSDTNTLHLNLGDGFFDDRSAQFGLALISRPFLSWGTGFYDFDLDGDEDLFISSGHVYPEAEEYRIDSDYRQPPQLFGRDGDRFEMNKSAGSMFTSKYLGRATAFGDIDNDGDVDVVMTTLNGPVHVFRNDAMVSDRSVVVVVPRDKGGNCHGLGSVVELTAGARPQRRWIYGGSYQSVNAPHAYFAVADAKASVTVKVTWADGESSTYKDVQVNRRVIIERGKEAPRYVALRR